MNSKSDMLLDKVIPNVKKVTETVIDWLAVTLMLMIFFLGLAQVIWRWVLNDPITWSEELIQLTYVWICYLGWSLASRKDSHIRITALMNALPKQGQKYLQISCNLLVILFSVLMVTYGINLIGVGAKRTAVSMTWLNYATVYVMGPIMNAVIICYQIAGIIEIWKKGPRNYADVDGGEEA